MVSEAFSSLEFAYLEAEEAFNQCQCDLASLKDEILRWKRLYAEKQNNIFQKRNKLKDAHILTKNIELLKSGKMVRESVLNNGKTKKERHQLRADLLTKANRLQNLERRRETDIDLLVSDCMMELWAIKNEIQVLGSSLLVLERQKTNAERKHKHYLALMRPQKMSTTAVRVGKSVCPPSIASIIKSDESLQQHFRVVHFPLVESLGKLFMRQPKGDARKVPWEWVSEARGSVCIPKDCELRLVLTGHMYKLEGLLQEGDLQYLHVEDVTTKFQGAGYFVHLKSLIITCGPSRDWMPEMNRPKLL